MREKTREIACLISGFTSERESVCDREIERERERKKERRRQCKMDTKKF